MSNKFVIITIIGSILLQFVVTNVDYFANLLNITTISIPVVFLIFAISLLIVIISEVYKIFYRMIKA